MKQQDFIYEEVKLEDGFIVLVDIPNTKYLNGTVPVKKLDVGLFIKCDFLRHNPDGTEDYLLPDGIVD